MSDPARKCPCEEAEAAIRQNLQIVGFDFGSLLTIVLPILIDVVSSCLKKSTAQATAARLASADWWVRLQVDRAIAQAAREAGHKLNGAQREYLRDQILLQLNTPEKAQAVIADIAIQPWVML